MNDLATTSDLKPVSFEKSKGLTKGQKAIVDILIRKAKDNEMLKRGDIEELYTTIEERRYYKFLCYEMCDYPKLDHRHGIEKYRSGRHEAIV